MQRNLSPYSAPASNHLLMAQGVCGYLQGKSLYQQAQPRRSVFLELGGLDIRNKGDQIPDTFLEGQLAKSNGV